MTSSTAAAVDQERKAPGRPRSARADEAIVDALLSLLAEGHTIDAISIEAVAAKAGVGKATIYRRWANKEALIIDAVTTMKGPIPAIAGENVRDDLITMITRVGHNQDNRAAGVLTCLLPELRRSATMQGCYQAVIEPRRRVMREVLERGVRTGELRPDLDVELAATLLTAPMIVQTTMGLNPRLSEENLAERVVDTVLAGIGQPSSRG